MLRTREYGTSHRTVVLLHGGPGAPGYMASLAREIAGRFRVLEPFQRRSGGGALTVARHVEDLHELLAASVAERPAIVGHSWGAMLALAHAAAYPDDVRALVLVGCGTFDATARGRLDAVREQRLTGALGKRLARVAESVTDPDEQLRAVGNIMLAADSHAPIVSELELAACDARGYQETWEDMVRLQERGVYPAAFSAITVPVLMLHGLDDPHPGSLIRASLRPHLPQLEYREWERCGHYPWLESAVRDEFLAVLGDWLDRHLGAAAAST